jgi:cytochrome c
MRLWNKVMLIGLAGTTLLLALNTQEERGKDLFVRRCSGCHAPDVNKEGPRLRGVYGRTAAAVTDFTYSDALKKTGVRWDEATLDRWLADPDAMAPDSDMAFRLKDPEERKAVIAYLKALKNP